MKTVLVINGESYWPDFLPLVKIVQMSIQQTSWVLKKGILHVADTEKVVQPDVILWRVGAIPPSEIQMTALQMIQLANVPCINSPSTLKIGFDRLSMLQKIQSLDLPVIDFDVVTSPRYLSQIKRDFPFVIKSGNFHGGYGKVLIEDEKKWQDIQDLLFVTSHYITIEPYIQYQRDIRYIAIGNKVWAMSRKGKFWKANVETTDFEEIIPEEIWVKRLYKLQHTIEADVVAIDILEEENGICHIVEYNDIPGLSGFSDELKYELAQLVMSKLENQ